eukprot:220880_1
MAHDETTNFGIDNPLNNVQYNDDEKQHGYSYSPHKIYKLYGNIKISKRLTEEIIPNYVQENYIKNVYDYLYKCVAVILSQNNDCVVGNCKIFNCGLHDKSGQDLYVVAYKSNQKNYPYTMLDKLYTKNKILQEFPIINLPNSVKIFTADISNTFHGYESFLKTKWHKVRVYNMTNHKQRLTFSITKTEFVKTIETFIYSNINSNNKSVLPIVMFTDDGYRIEYVQIIPLHKNGHVYSIGVSYIYDKHYDIKVTGIHLNKNNILNQHRLICSKHNCRCLDSFKSEIDYLHIGNPDDDKNRAKDLKKKHDILKIENRAFKTENEKLKNQNNFLAK